MWKYKHRNVVSLSVCSPASGSLTAEPEWAGSRDVASHCNNMPTAAPFPSGTSNPPAPATLYTLYPPHTSGQYSYRYCTNANGTTVPVAALSSGTLPVLSAGLNSSLACALKYEKDDSSPLTHCIAEIILAILSTGNAATQPSTEPQEATTPESMAASTEPSPSTSSVQSLEQPAAAFPNTFPAMPHMTANKQWMWNT